MGGDLEEARCVVAMATMQPANKPGKRRRGRCKNRKVSHEAAAPPRTPERTVTPPSDRQGPAALHVACQYGQLADVQLLVESGRCGVNSGGPGGHRPLHAVLSPQSAPNTAACLRYLLERGAGVNATTDDGQTPLHLAASEGLPDCAEILAQAGADVLARDDMGLTPLDLAYVCRRREVARYLRSCVWEAEKKKEMEERRRVQALYCDLVEKAKMIDLDKKTLTEEKVAEWANKKGLALPLIKDRPPRATVSRYHTECVSSDQENPNVKSAKGPRESKSPSPKKRPPWSIYTSLEDRSRLPDLRDSVAVWGAGCDSGGRQPQYTTKWDGTPRPAPDLPLDALERVLFPRAFPSRTPRQHFSAQDIREVTHRGGLRGPSSSPWTEVALHLGDPPEPTRH